ADGRVFSGDQALAAGLVDELGDSTDAVELAGRLAGIKGRPEVRRNADHFGELFDMLQSRFSGGLAGLASGLSESFTPHSGLLYLWRGW
ncbi:MAG: S49 family peptidase, partial [Elusimicrobia bacterium]|nr:S49 family peptidase [Elusimicrobiota bacterium]